MSEGIRLIVGLGNPGPQYRHTRHNAGAIFLDALCRAEGTELRPEAKFLGECARATLGGREVRLLFPTTYMNRSGAAVAAMAQYFKIPPAQILVVYDELDLPAGTPRLKMGGGAGGHNGMRDTISALGTGDFPRLRLGIGHPGDSSKVLNFVLGEPSKKEAELLEDAIARSLAVLPLLVEGKFQIAMNNLHTKPTAAQPAGKDNSNGH